MNCPACGAELAPDSRFCSECGTPVASTSAPSAGARRTVVVAVCACVAVVLVVCAVVYAVRGLTAPATAGEAGTTVATGTQTAQDAPVAATVPDGTSGQSVDGQEAQATAADTPQQVATEPVTGEATPTTRTLDLANQSDRRALNVLLSNFTETMCGRQGSDTYAFDRDTSSGQEWAQLAFSHILQNGGAYEEVHEQVGDEYLGNVRVSAAALDAVARRLTGTTFDWATLEDPQYSGYRYRDGYVYGEVTNGPFCSGPAAATGVTSVGDGLVSVDFAAWYIYPPSMGYEIGDGSQYDLDEAGITSRYGTPANVHGTALVEYEETDGNVVLRLVRFTAAP